ncbi:hypothetical protein H9P43_010126 [Blastocladiella emersonii ATCC 22665]|nr:hypothetical protein H9P43_010126 [Blastocladiella emersonii ATCC 22665]
MDSSSPPSSSSSSTTTAAAEPVSAAAPTTATTTSTAAAPILPSPSTVAATLMGNQDFISLFEHDQEQQAQAQYHHQQQYQQQQQRARYGHAYPPRLTPPPVADPLASSAAFDFLAWDRDLLLRQAAAANPLAAAAAASASANPALPPYRRTATAAALPASVASLNYAYLRDLTSTSPSGFPAFDFGPPTLSDPLGPADGPATAAAMYPDLFLGTANSSYLDDPAAVLHPLSGTAAAVAAPTPLFRRSMTTAADIDPLSPHRHVLAAGTDAPRALRPSQLAVTSTPLPDPHPPPHSSASAATSAALDLPLAPATVTSDVAPYYQQRPEVAAVVPAESRNNHAIRIVYGTDGMSLVRADHDASPCRDPMILCGRLVDMSVHMEVFLQDLIPRKGEDHLDWQPVDITFDVLASRLRQTLKSMELFRADMARKASAERAKAAAASLKRLQKARAARPVPGSVSAAAAPVRGLIDASPASVSSVSTTE